MQLPPPSTPAENGFGELASLPLRRKLCTCSPFSPSSSGCLSSRKMRNLKIRCCHVMPPMTLTPGEVGLEVGPRSAISVTPLFLRGVLGLLEGRAPTRGSLRAQVEGPHLSGTCRKGPWVMRHKTAHHVCPVMLGFCES